jgi:hypothetical protein
MSFGVLPFVGVGLLWGATNPLIKRGSLAVERKKKAAAARAADGGAAGAGGGFFAEWRALLTTPSFLVPQVLNQLGGLLFIALLSGADISVAVPAANATSLAANAAADVLLGERYRLRFLLPGTALVALGLYLCTVKA